MHSRQWKLICNTICETLGCFWEFQKTKEFWLCCYVCNQGSLVCSIMSAKKLGIEVILIWKIRRHDTNTISTLFNLKNYHRLTPDKNIVLSINSCLLLHNIKLSNYLSNWQNATEARPDKMRKMDQTQIRLLTVITSVICHITVPKCSPQWSIKIIKSFPLIFKHNHHIQNSEVYIIEIFVNPVYSDIEIRGYKINEIWSWIENIRLI